MTTDERIEKVETILTGLLKWLQTDEISSSGKDKYGELLAMLSPRCESKPEPITPFEKCCNLAGVKTDRETIERRFTWNAAIDAVRRETREQGLTLPHAVLDNLRAK